MKGLICTHHLESWSGSEVVTIELVEELAAQGVDVTLYSPFVDFGFARGALGDDVPILFDPAAVEIASHDFLFVNHQTTARFLPHQCDEALTGRDRPVFVFNHMSPFEPFELPGTRAEGRLADIILCNSRETARRLAEFGPDFAQAELFANPAPRRFARAAPPAAAPRVRRILSVSNHVPDELGRAFDILRAQGVEVTRIGAPDAARRLQPDDLWSHDAVVTTGKTVQQALRARCPVFCYDWFQGPGWLGPESFPAAADTNFSGRCHPVRRDPGTLAREIETGFAAAAAFAAGVCEARLAPYRLEDEVGKLLARIADLRRQRRAGPAGRSVGRGFRGMLAQDRAAYDLADREYAVARAGAHHVVTVRDHRAGGAPDRPIKARILRRPAPGTGMVVAAFSYRYDAHLVPALLENLAPAVHGWVAWDDRAAGHAYSGDAVRQAALFEAARDLGADWILATDPDERFESALADRIANLTNDHGSVCWTFQCREMFAAASYRVDGLWRDRPRLRLFPCLPGMEPDGQDLHGFWTRNGLKLPVRPTGLDFYHLRMATPERRRHRRDLYAAADPDRARQAIGYDYLCDERGMELREVPADRAFRPRHAEDGGLWAPPIDAIGNPDPDPPAARLRWLVAHLGQGGAAGAFHAADDIGRSGDTDIGLCAAALALRADLPDEAVRIGTGIGGGTEAAPPEAFVAGLLAGRAKLALGDPAGAADAAAAALDRVPDSALARRTRARCLPVPERFRQADADWRRWAPEGRLTEGPRVRTAGIAVVVLSLGAPGELAGAVASLMAQDPVPEIVVVNSGGGDAARVLRAHLDHIRLVCTPRRLGPGAARNVGIDASAAPIVSFLASDCRAAPGWVAARLRRHGAGAEAVASAMIPDAPGNICNLLSSAQLHWTRWPDAPAEARGLYGVSYTRALLDLCGYFPTGLRVAEDTHFNAVVADRTRIDWAPEVQTLHLYPRTVPGLIADMARRGYRRAAHPPFSTRADYDDLRDFTERWIRNKTHGAYLAAQRATDAGPVRRKALQILLRLSARAEVTALRLAGRRLIRARTGQAAAARAGLSEDAVDPAAALETPELHLARAEALMAGDAGRDEARIRYALRRAVALAPRDPVPLKKLCGFLLDRGHPAEAFAAADMACVMAPGLTGFWWIRQDCAARAGYREEEYATLQHLLALNPADPAVHEALAGFHARSGNPERAALRASHAAELRPA